MSATWYQVTIVICDLEIWRRHTGIFQSGSFLDTSGVFNVPLILDTNARIFTKFKYCMREMIFPHSSTEQIDNIT